MKKIIIIVLVVAVLIGAYFFIRNEKSGTNSDTPNVSGKIDINYVCESSLAYMSFPNGDEAAKFVAECKEGKHPEVIEKYKTDMNLGAGAAI